MFDLTKIKKGVEKRAKRIIIYGPPGIGKSTFGASSPNVIGIWTERGLDEIGCDRFPEMATTLKNVYDALGVLMRSDHEYKNLLIDSLDWLESLVVTHVCEKNNIDKISSLDYGKGYKMAEDEWRHLFLGLDFLMEQKKMNIICTAHEGIENISTPTLDTYSRFVLKMDKRSNALVMEWADIIAHAQYRTYVSQKDVGFGNKKGQATGTGERILNVNPTNPCFISKTRIAGFPEQLPLSWNEFDKYLTKKNKEVKK